MVAEPAITESRPKVADTISGEVERIIFFAEDTAFAIFSLAVLDGKRELSVVVKGHIPGLQVGLHLACDGKVVHDSRRGEQFHADLIRIAPPTSAEGIRRYLCSGLIQGVGPVLAGRIVDHFGDKTIDVLSSDSGRLREIPGLGEAKVASIRSSWKEHVDARNIMVFCQQYGISPSKCGKIVKKYGEDAIKTISEDPYTLCRDIDGIGFLTADKIALQMEIPPNSYKRIGAGVVHVLDEAKSEGHCALPYPQLLKRAGELLQVPETDVSTVAIDLVNSGELFREDIRGRDIVYLPYMRAYERSIAAILRRLLSAGEAKFAKGACDADLAEAEQATGKTLAVNQRLAVITSLKNRVSVITGGPGSGKSTILGVVRCVLSKHKAKVVLCAPTGRAAKRMTETAGIESKTIHRLLKFDPNSGDFSHNAKNPLVGDVFVIDEASMLDIPLAYKLLRALPREAQVIFVGDVDQLPSVGPGAFLADLIHSQAIPTTFLREIFRQAKSSKIITNAHMVNQGLVPEDGSPGDDFFFVKRDDPERIKEMMRHIVTERIPKAFGLNPLRDVQILAPMHKGPLGIKELNNFFQNVLNPDRGLPSHTCNGYHFRIGDKVLQTRNNYDLDVFNGDLGFIEDIDTKEKKARINFDGAWVTYRFQDFSDLVLAYTYSIHKSQGAEFPAVVMPMVKGFYHMLQKNLVYTGMTRGKKLVVMVGDKAALAMAVRNNKANERFGGLIHRLGSDVSDWLEEELFK